MVRNFKIFLADDDADDVSLFKEVLSEINKDISFDSAMNGVEAIQKLKSQSRKPDLIFLDLNMPRVDGKQCMREIKNEPTLNHIPVLIFTTSSYSKDVQEALALGAVCFITKPTDIRELKNILTVIISNAPDNISRALTALHNSNTVIHC